MSVARASPTWVLWAQTRVLAPGPRWAAQPVDGVGHVVVAHVPRLAVARAPWPGSSARPRRPPPRSGRHRTRPRRRRARRGAAADRHQQVDDVLLARLGHEPGAPGVLLRVLVEGGEALPGPHARPGGRRGRARRARRRWPGASPTASRRRARRSRPVRPRAATGSTSAASRGSRRPPRWPTSRSATARTRPAARGRRGRRAAAPRTHWLTRQQSGQSPSTPMHVEAVALDEQAAELAAPLVELVGPVRGLADAHEARAADPGHERVEILFRRQRPGQPADLVDLRGGSGEVHGDPSQRRQDGGPSAPSSPVAEHLVRAEGPSGGPPTGPFRRMTFGSTGARAPGPR